MSRGLKIVFTLLIVSNFILAILYTNTSAEYRIYKRFTQADHVHTSPVNLPPLEPIK